MGPVTGIHRMAPTPPWGAPLAYRRLLMPTLSWASQLHALRALAYSARHQLTTLYRCPLTVENLSIAPMPEVHGPAQPWSASFQHPFSAPMVCTLMAQE